MLWIVMSAGVRRVWCRASCLMMAASSRTNLLHSYKFQFFFPYIFALLLEGNQGSGETCWETLTCCVSSLQNEFGVFWRTIKYA